MQRGALGDRLAADRDGRAGQQALLRQARLADAGLAQQQQDRRRPCAQGVDLRLAADERCIERRQDAFDRVARQRR
jgi:hypothetical protein